MTVRKRGGRWYCRFQIDGVRYERRCDLATDEKTALQVEKVIATEIMRGNLNFAKAKDTPKVKDALELLENHSKTNKLSYASDKIKIEKFREYFTDSKPISEIDSKDINDFKSWIKEKKVIEKIKIPNPDKTSRKKFIYKEIETLKEISDTTINRYLQTYSKMFTLCIAKGWIVQNPCKLAGKFREENHSIRYLRKDEEERLFKIVSSNYPHLEPIIITALQTGMRKTEIFTLKWSQVDFKKGFIEVLKSKSGKARKIPISKKLDYVLRSQLANSDSEYVFINPATQKPYVDIKKAFTSILEKANIENFRFHDFRHTVATRLVESGVDIVTVKDILGHSEITTTMRYAHSVTDNKKSAMECL